MSFYRHLLLAVFFSNSYVLKVKILILSLYGGGKCIASSMSCEQLLIRLELKSRIIFYDALLYANDAKAMVLERHWSLLSLAGAGDDQTKEDDFDPNQDSMLFAFFTASTKMSTSSLVL